VEGQLEGSVLPVNSGGTVPVSGVAAAVELWRTGMAGCPRRAAAKARMAFQRMEPGAKESMPLGLPRW